MRHNWVVTRVGVARLIGFACLTALVACSSSGSDSTVQSEASTTTVSSALRAEWARAATTALERTTGRPAKYELRWRLRFGDREIVEIEAGTFDPVNSQGMVTWRVESTDLELSNAVAKRAAKTDVGAVSGGYGWDKQQSLVNFKEDATSRPWAVYLRGADFDPAVQKTGRMPGSTGLRLPVVAGVLASPPFVATTASSQAPRLDRVGDQAGAGGTSTVYVAQLPAASLTRDVNVAAVSRILLPNEPQLVGDASAELHVSAAGSVGRINADVTASVKAAASAREDTKVLAEQLTKFTIEWQLLDDAPAPVALPPINQRRPDRATDRRLGMEMRVGDCFNSEGQNAEMPVPCTEPHRFEVYAVVVLGKEGDPYPAASATPPLTERISQLCRTAIATAIRLDMAGRAFPFVYLVPNEAAWTGFAAVSSPCLVKFDTPTTGSVRR